MQQLPFFQRSQHGPRHYERLKQGYQSSLKALSTVLAAKGIYYNPALAPYFFSGGNPALQSAATAYQKCYEYYVSRTSQSYKGSDLMGAAFNLRLLWAERGAYAHNGDYTKRLIYDSIDLVDNGILDNTVSVTIQGLGVTDTFT